MDQVRIGWDLIMIIWVARDETLSRSMRCREHAVSSATYR
jgi:hypothetical protein